MKPNTLSNQLREYVDTLRGRREALEAERGALRDEREHLLSAPLSIDDAKQFVCDYIDRCAADYPGLAKWSELFDRLLYPRRYEHLSKVRANGKAEPIGLRDIEIALADPNQARQTVFEHGLNFFGAASDVNKHSDYAAYFFFGDVIKKRVLEHFDTLAGGYLPVDSERIGPPVSERRERIAAIEARLSEIEAAIADIAAETRELSAAAVPKSERERAAARITAEEEQRDAAILYAYNGRNAEELAKMHRVSVRQVEAIANRAFAVRQH